MINNQHTHNLFECHYSHTYCYRMWIFPYFTIMTTCALSRWHDCEFVMHACAKFEIRLRSHNISRQYHSWPCLWVTRESLGLGNGRASNTDELHEQQTSSQACKGPKRESTDEQRLLARCGSDRRGGHADTTGESIT
jgi:hypothetical protein